MKNNLLEELKRLRELADKATPGPWRTSWHPCENGPSHRSIRINDARSDGDIACDIFFGANYYNNLDLMAASREAIPMLCEALEKAFKIIDLASVQYIITPDSAPLSRMAKELKKEWGLEEEDDSSCKHPDGDDNCSLCSKDAWLREQE